LILRPLLVKLIWSSKIIGQYYKGQFTKYFFDLVKVYYLVIFKLRLPLHESIAVIALLDITGYAKLTGGP